MDYAQKKGVSLSTLRRHIKAEKVRYRLVEGRYLLFDDLNESKKQASSSDTSMLELKERVDCIETELHQAKEEIAELKMLLALYEEKIPESYQMAE
jgi:chromosome segregation ATPase